MLNDLSFEFYTLFRAARKGRPKWVSKKTNMKKVNLIREEYVSPEMEIHTFVFHSCILDGSGNTENPGGNDNPDNPWPSNP